MMQGKLASERDRAVHILASKDGARVVNQAPRLQIIVLGNFSTKRNAVQPGDSYTTMCFYLAGHMDEDPQL